MTLKIKFIPKPQLEFFEKKSSCFIIVIIYIYIIYLIGLNLCPTLCLILCPIFPIPKNIIHLTYRIMSSLNTLDFVFDFVSRFVSHFVSEPISKRNFIKKTFPNRFKAAEWPDSRIVSLQYEIDIERNITKNSVKPKTRKNMERSVAYSLVRRRDFKDPDGNEKLFYAQAQARGEMGIREIGQRLEQMCTVTYADIMAVLCALPSVIRQGLASGEIVRLGDLGYLQIGLKSKGAKTEKEFTNSLIKKAKFRFRPGKDMSDLVMSLNYERVPVRKKKGE